MSDKNQEFWKELMGDDFKVDLNGAPDTSAPPPVSPNVPESQKGAPEGGDEPFIDSSQKSVEPGFTIEYISRSEQERPAGTGPSEPRIQRPIAPGMTPAQPRAQSPRPQPSSEPKIQRPIAPDMPPIARAPEGSGQRSAEPRIQRPIAPGMTPAQPGTQSPQPQSSSEPKIQRPIAPEGQAPQTGAFRPAQPQMSPRLAGTAQGGTATGGGSSRGGRRKSKDDNFEVEFDFDSEYSDVDEKAISRGRTKRTGCLSGILMFLFVVCVSAVLASVGWIWATDVLGLDGDDEAVEVTLPEDIFHTEEREKENDEGEVETVEINVADIDKVAEELYQRGLIKYRWLFKLYVKLSKSGDMLKPGTYTLNMVYDYRAIVHGMTGARGPRETTTLTIPEGYSVTQIVDLLVENKVCEREELLDALKNYDFDYDFLDKGTLGQDKRLEGYLFPDTYEFYVDDDPINVISKFLDNFKRKWEDDFDALAEEQGCSRWQILIIASMIEKEAGNDAERDLISSVIYNRLRHPDRQGTNGLLQINATIYYVIADTGEEYSTEIDSPYNTYLYPGLPAGPIANPGIASIRAALQPRDTNYYYYALGKNKSHQFFETYREFTNFVNSDEYGGNQ